jgi:hypothetical protein
VGERFRNAVREPFHYFDKGSMATVSGFSAVARVGRLEQGGFVAWVAWLRLHPVYLVGFKSTKTTVISWMATFLTMNRSQLTITERRARPQRPAERSNQPDSVAQGRGRFRVAEPPVLADQLTGIVPAQVSAEADLAEAVRNAWLVVEAIPEWLELKQQMFGKLDELAAPDAILASNSSSYASRMFLDKVGHPERVLNIHFYMPPKQAAVDVMSCGKTDRDVIDFAIATLPQFGLDPFEARRESTGFIFNRVWAAVKRRAWRSSPKACPHRRTSTRCSSSTPAPPVPSG